MRFWIIDTFTTDFFGGGSAAVIVGGNLEYCQKIASELNVSETIFVIPQHENHFAVRWFSSTKELRLCGHSTLAAAHVLWTELDADKELPLYFESRCGILKTTLSESSITIDFPAQFVEKVPLPEALLSALDVLPIYVGFAQDTYFVEVHSAQDIIDISPDFTALLSLDGRGVIVTADSSDGKYDFVSRFFEPRMGILEDTASAYAYSVLAPYWTKRLGKNTFHAQYLSPRGGEAQILYENGRVYITGKAITVCMGDFRF